MSKITASTVAWSSLHSGLHRDSKPMTESFTPTGDALLFGLFINSPTDYSEVICAFFSPDLAVDSMGRVLRVPREHFDAIAELAFQSACLPDTTFFRNTWRVKHERSDRQIRTLPIHLPGTKTLKMVSVYGYEKGRETLQRDVEGRKVLPKELMELFGLLEEGMEGYAKGEKDAQMIKAVGALLSRE